ncbi:hypothetical protein AC578_9391 [Pseudocercospora eumusae]|nr:hypothetical protein AC578_9391 [Pseudocercospora eumusae]
MNTGWVTMYTPSRDPDHPNACGGLASEKDNVVAVASDWFTTTNSNDDPICDVNGGRQIRAWLNGTSVTVRVIDRCRVCGKGDLDLSLTPFRKLTGDFTGKYHNVEWEFMQARERAWRQYTADHVIMVTPSTEKGGLGPIPELVLECVDGVRIKTGPEFVMSSDHFRAYLRTQQPKAVAASTKATSFIVTQATHWLQKHTPVNLPESPWWEKTEELSIPQNDLYLPCDFEQLLQIFDLARNFAIEPLIRVTTHQLWNDVPDFSSLCKLNEMFLQGIIQRTPYHEGPIFEETLPMVPSLLQLQKLGVFTDGSRPYGIVTYEVDDEGKEWFYEQRPCLDFIMTTHNDNYKKLFDGLQKRPEIVMLAWTVNPPQRFPFQEKSSNDESAFLFNNLEAFRVVNSSGGYQEDPSTLEYEFDPDNDPEFRHQSMRKFDPVFFRWKARDWKVNVVDLVLDVALAM